jgi:GT2 family glycosyltransferase
MSTAPSLPRATLIVLNWNGRALLARCLPSIIRQDYPDAEVLLVDNGSTDGSVEWAASAYPQVRLLPQARNLGYAGGMNAGLRAAQGELIAFLNNDVILQADWLRHLAEAVLADARIGIAGCKLLYPAETSAEGQGDLIQHAGGILRYPLALPDHIGFRQPDTGQFDALKDVDYVTGAAFMARREVLDQLGGFDEGFFPGYFEETDLCFRARAAGWRVVVAPQAVGVHLESRTTVRDSPAYYTWFHQGRLRFVLKHYTPSQVLDDFVPAERARWPEGIAAAEREPLRQAYRHTASQLADILAARSGPALSPATVEALRRALYDLAARGAARQIDAVIDRLHAQAALREHVFTSRLPLVGRVRALWNSISTRWYVLPLSAQQSEFNALTAQAFGEALRLLEETRADLEEQSIRLEEAQANLLAVDRELTALMRRVALYEQRLREGADAFTDPRALTPGR